MTPEEIRKRSRQKAIKLEDLIEGINRKIKSTSNQLLQTIYLNFLQNLSSESGKINPTINSAINRMYLRAFNDFSKKHLSKLTTQIGTDFESIIGENENFYKTTAKADKTISESIRKTINKRLGIDTDGSLIKQGYMSGLLDESQVRIQIQQFIYKEMMKGVGYEGLRESIKNFITGNESKVGIFDKYYQTFSYDVYAQVNALTSAMYADKLGMKYFIYNGGLIETSRKFCIEKNGKVFSSEEAEDWIDDPDLTAIISKETYDWRIERGGYNCRHSIDYIAKEIAFALRPDLKNN